MRSQLGRKRTASLPQTLLFAVRYQTAPFTPYLRSNGNWNWTGASRRAFTRPSSLASSASPCTWSCRATTLRQTRHSNVVSSTFPFTFGRGIYAFHRSVNHSVYFKATLRGLPPRSGRRGTFFFKRSRCNKPSPTATPHKQSNTSSHTPEPHKIKSLPKRFWQRWTADQKVALFVYLFMGTSGMVFLSGRMSKRCC